MRKRILLADTTQPEFSFFTASSFRTDVMRTSRRVSFVFNVRRISRMRGRPSVFCRRKESACERRAGPQEPKVVMRRLAIPRQLRPARRILRSNCGVNLLERNAMYSFRMMWTEENLHRLRIVAKCLALCRRARHELNHACDPAAIAFGGRPKSKIVSHTREQHDTGPSARTSPSSLSPASHHASAHRSQSCDVLADNSDAAASCSGRSSPFARFGNPAFQNPRLTQSTGCAPRRENSRQHCRDDSAANPPPSAATALASIASRADHPVAALGFERASRHSAIAPGFSGGGFDWRDWREHNPPRSPLHRQALTTRRRAPSRCRCCSDAAPEERA